MQIQFNKKYRAILNNKRNASESQPLQHGSESSLNESWRWEGTDMLTSAGRFPAFKSTLSMTRAKTKGQRFYEQGIW